MKLTIARSIGALGFSMLWIALASSCSLKTPVRTADPDLAKAPTTAPPVRIAQLDFGRQSLFARCAVPACPTVTPKTLALVGPPDAAADPMTVETGASLGVGEAIVSSGSLLAKPTSKANFVPQMVTVHFASGDISLSRAARELLDQVPEHVSAEHGLTISGRTDSAGSHRVNESLALARATAVRDYLCARHPKLASPATVGAKGGCCFVAPNGTPEGRAMNRRVEIVFTPAGERH